MAKLIKKEEPNIVWSDDPNVENAKKSKGAEAEVEIIPSAITLKIGLEKNKRGGKVVSIVFNFPRNDSYFEALAKELKKKCGTGGSFKADAIEIQGDHRQKLKDLLEAKGFKVKLAGG